MDKDTFICKIPSLEVDSEKPDVSDKSINLFLTGENPKRIGYYTSRVNTSSNNSFTILSVVNILFNKLNKFVKCLIILY